MALWSFNQNFEQKIEVIRNITSILNVVLFVVLVILIYTLTRYFGGSNFRVAELKMRIIPFILDDRLRNEKIEKEDERTQME